MKKMLLTLSFLFAGAFDLVGSETPQPVLRSDPLPDPLPDSLVKGMERHLSRWAFDTMHKELERDGVIKLGDAEQLKACFEKTGVTIRYPHLQKPLEQMAYSLENRTISSTFLSEARVIVFKNGHSDLVWIVDVITKCGKHCSWERPVETMPSSESSVAANPSAAVVLGDKVEKTPQS